MASDGGAEVASNGGAEAIPSLADDAQNPHHLSSGVFGHGKPMTSDFSRPATADKMSLSQVTERKQQQREPVHT